MELDKSKWERVRLEDVVINKKTSVSARNCGLDRYIAGDHMTTEDLHIRKFGLISEDYLGPAFHRKFENGDILYGSRRTYLKKVAIADFDGITSNTTFVLRENKEKLVPGLIPFLMLSDRFTAHSIMHSKGSVNPYINFKDIGRYEFLLPPKDQQSKLTSLLWAADEVMETYLKLRECLQAISFLETEKYNTSDYQKVPLKDCLKEKRVISNSPHKREKYIALEHVESGSFSCSNYSPSSNAEANCFCFDEGDLLYSKLRPYLDKAFIAEFSGVCTTELMIYTVENAEKEYVLHLLHSPSFIKYTNSMSFGTKMPRVSNEIVSSFQAYLPDLKEQRRINSELKKIRMNISLALSMADKAKKIKFKLINKIFS